MLELLFDKFLGEKTDYRETRKQADKLAIGESVHYKACEYVVSEKKPIGSQINLTLTNNRSKITVNVNKKELIKTK